MKSFCWGWDPKVYWFSALKFIYCIFWLLLVAKRFCIVLNSSVEIFFWLFTGFWRFEIGPNAYGDWVLNKFCIVLKSCILIFYILFWDGFLALLFFITPSLFTVSLNLSIFLLFLFKNFIDALVNWTSFPGYFLWPWIDFGLERGAFFEFALFNYRF